MESQNITLLSDLHVSNDNEVLKVRVVRVWRRPFFNNPSETYSLELILVDEKDNRIQESCLSKWFLRFEKHLVENSVLIVKKPSLGHNGGDYKYIDNDLKVCFNHSTHVLKCSEWKGSLFGFKFTDFHTILDCNAPEKFSIDIIGVVLNVSPIIPFTTKKGKDTTKMTVILEDLEGRTIFITLFEEYATQMNHYAKRHPAEPHVIIILQFAKFHIFNGAYSVSNSFNVSKLFINSNIDEINSYKKSFVEKSGDEMSTSFGGECPKIFYSLKQDFLDNTEFNHIGEVSHISKVKSVIIVGTIKCVIPEIQWYYLACKKCNKKVVKKVTTYQLEDGSGSSKDEISYECTSEDCIGEVISAITRFKIPIKVQDNTGSVSLTLFDREAKRILKRNANDVIESYLQEVDNVLLPREFNALVEQKYAFKIDVSLFNLEKNYQSYAVSKVTNDVQIIQALDKKYYQNQGPTSESANLSSQDFRCIDSFSFKEVDSFSGDNETPVSNVGTNNVKGKNVEVQNVEDDYPQESLKRNLVEIYDVEENVAHSVTKPRSNSSGGEDGCAKYNMITPKVEK